MEYDEAKIALGERLGGLEKDPIKIPMIFRPEWRRLEAELRAAYCLKKNAFGAVNQRWLGMKDGKLYPVVQSAAIISKSFDLFNRDKPLTASEENVYGKFSDWEIGEITRGDIGSFKV
jgi:hypothetical protein